MANIMSVLCRPTRNSLFVGGNPPGVPVMVFLVSLVPRVYFGVKNMWKKFRKFGKTFGDLASLPTEISEPFLHFSEHV